MRFVKHLFLMQTVLLCGAMQQALASGCTPSSTRHTLMNAFAGTIKVSGSVEKYQEIARFNFQQDAPVPYIATCTDDATIYAYAGQGSPTTNGAISIGNIDGQPAYILPNSFAGGLYHYAYVLIDDLTGRPYGEKTNPTELKVNDGDNQDNKMRPRSATVILYANIDNPSKEVYLSNITLGGLLPDPLGATYGAGVTYMFKSGQIAPVTASCTLENAHNLSIHLPGAPVSALPEIGSTHEKGKDELRIKCTGEMKASITLNLDNDQVTSDESGDDTVVKNQKENDRDGAKGIGFVVSTDDGKRLVNRSGVFLKELGDGTSYVPIYAEYYRYGHEVSAGKVEAIANFVVEFK